MEKILEALRNHKPGILGGNHFLKYAVLVPLIEIEGETHVLFEVRAHNLRRQPGEICFPGGKIDVEDENEKCAAIRETSEELGLSEDHIKNVYPLDYLVTPYGTIIYPFAGTISDMNDISVNPDEVEEIFTVPISHFQKVQPKCYKVDFQAKPEKGFPFHLIVGGENYNWRTRQVYELFYCYEDKVIWGLTAKILHHFMELIR
ncbi:NUDIX hydrolase [Peribacillus tepidiphilus]|uniref:NUDIX hydrolase n=1 Tax=Peribacillus tepidiphilus TaxID=2652445 RepID=UPI001CDCF248|nr:CoA pyrophosphatase [Peribacillus tepidiphilus]